MNAFDWDDYDDAADWDPMRPTTREQALDALGESIPYSQRAGVGWPIAAHIANQPDPWKDAS